MQMTLFLCVQEGENSVLSVLYALYGQCMIIYNHELKYVIVLLWEIQHK